MILVNVNGNLQELMLAGALLAGPSGNSSRVNPSSEFMRNASVRGTSSTGSSVTFFPGDFEETSDHEKQMRDLETTLTTCTDSDQAPTPEVLALARVVLSDALGMNLRPTRVNVSIDGGAIVQFVQGRRYADIELLNTGEVMGVITQPGLQPNVWTIDIQDPQWSTESLESIHSALYNAP